MTDAKDWLARMANGDARQAITMLENTAKFYKDITIESLKDVPKFVEFAKLVLQVREDGALFGELIFQAP